MSIVFDSFLHKMKKIDGNINFNFLKVSQVSSRNIDKFSHLGHFTVCKSLLHSHSVSLNEARELNGPCSTLIEGDCTTNQGDFLNIELL